MDASVLSDLQFSSPRRPDKSRQRRIRHRLSNTTNGRFISPDHGKQVVELLYLLVVVDAFTACCGSAQVSMTLFCVPS